MPSKSKIKGNAFEKEVVNRAIDAGLKSRRAWGSNGNALGLEAEVDVVIGKYAVQCKKRAKIASFLQIPACCNFVAFKENRGPILCLIKFEELLALLKDKE